MFSDPRSKIKFYITIRLPQLINIMFKRFKLNNEKKTTKTFLILYFGIFNITPLVLSTKHYLQTHVIRHELVLWN